MIQCYQQIELSHAKSQIIFFVWFLYAMLIRIITVFIVWNFGHLIVVVCSSLYWPQCYKFGYNKNWRLIWIYCIWNRLLFSLLIMATLTKLEFKFAQNSTKTWIKPCQFRRLTRLNLKNRFFIKMKLENCSTKEN